MVLYFYPRGYVEGKDDFLIYMGRCVAQHASTSRDVGSSGGRSWLFGGVAVDHAGSNLDRTGSKESLVPSTPMSSILLCPLREFICTVVRKQHTASNG